MTVIDFKAARKLAKTPKNILKRILSNVFCAKCGVTTIVEYTIHDDKLGILLKGKRKECGNELRRFIEEA